MKIEISNTNAHLLDVLRLELFNYVKDVSTFDYDALIMLLHLGFSETALMETLRKEELKCNSACAR